MKKLLKTIPKYFLADALLGLGLLLAAEAALGLFGLTLRKIPLTICAILLVVGAIAGVAQLLLKLRGKKLKAILLVLFAALIATAAVRYAPLALFMLADEEHIVKRDGGRYLATVSSFLETNVWYFDYKNALVRGKQAKIYEWYGDDAAFDPFAGDYGFEALRTVYYDDDGNVIKTIERDPENDAP